MKAKYLFPVLLVLFLGTSFKSKTGASLVVHTLMCEDGNDEVNYMSVEVLKNGKHYATLEPCRNEPLSLEALDPATYQIVYTSIFETKEKKEVVITEARTYEVDVCMDRMDHDAVEYTPVIDRLKPGEKYNLYINSQGCFHWDKDTFTVSRAGDQYSATWGKRSKTLTAEELVLLRHFEKEMSEIGIGGCTTETTYTLVYGKKKILENTDATCHWGGVYALVRKLYSLKPGEE